MSRGKAVRAGGACRPIADEEGVHKEGPAFLARQCRKKRRIGGLLGQKKRGVAWPLRGGPTKKKKKGRARVSGETR